MSNKSVAMSYYTKKNPIQKSQLGKHCCLVKKFSKFFSKLGPTLPICIIGHLIK